MTMVTCSNTCNVKENAQFISEKERLRNIIWLFLHPLTTFLDLTPSEEKESLCREDAHEDPVSPKAGSEEEISPNSTSNVVVSRECLDNFMKQLLKLEESLNKLELEQRSQIKNLTTE